VAGLGRLLEPTLRSIVLGLLFASLTACTAHRRFQLPASRCARLALGGGTGLRRSPRPDPGQLLFHDGREQLETHLTEALRASTLPGERVERAEADVVLDVFLRIEEDRRVNRWLVGAIGGAMVSQALTLGGTACLVGNDAPRPALLGTAALAAMPVTSLVGSLFPASTHWGTVEATLVYRRTSDGVAIAEEKVRAVWERKTHAWSLERKLAERSGQAAEELERRVLAHAAATLGAFTEAQLGRATAEPHAVAARPPRATRR
jgi:hypothetical protein